MKASYIKYYFVLFLYLPLLSFTQVLEVPEVTTEELKYYVGYLADDSLKGRRAGSAEALSSAVFIRDNLKRSGLELLAENGLQFYDIVVDLEYGDDNSMLFYTKEFTIGKDFNPYSFSANGSLNAGIVFAGYGFTFENDSIKWDDYTGLDVKDKWVLILRGDPKPAIDEDEFINYSTDRAKVLNARDHGAGGVLFVSGYNYNEEDKLVDLYFDKIQSDAGIPVIHIKRELADMFLEPAGKTLVDIEKEIIDNMASTGFVLDNELFASVDIEKQTVRDQNVVAMIRGNDPELSEEFIAIGAHYDHLGMGGQGSGSRRPDMIEPHNGADDNASGVAGIMEIAEKLAADRENLKRSLLVIAFGGEEMGLLGSSHFVKDPPVEIDDIVGMVNFDMIGRLDKEKKAVSVSGTGTAEGLEDLLKEFEKDYDLSFNHSPEGYGPSDHAAFYASDIPVLFISTGAHSDYHTPFDDTKYINFEGQKEVAEFSAGLVRELINLDHNLVYKEAGPKRNVGYRGKLKVTLGIMPDFTAESNEGLPVGGVTKGRPADKAGMKKGDLIIAMDGKAVENIYDYMNRLKTFKPGQIITVDVIRDGKKKVLIVQLD